MNDSKSAPFSRQANVNRQTLLLGAWTAAWLATMAIATFGPGLLWSAHTGVTVAAIALNLLVGLGMIVANRNHLRSLDELQQKIQLEAMGITLGVALVAGLAYSNLATAKVIGHDAEISHLVILMGLTYLGAVALGTRKYR